MNNHVRKLDEFCEDLDADLKLPSSSRLINIDLNAEGGHHLNRR